ncbi:MAG: HDOD domain-containing protein [Desulfobacterales bacterium]
MNQGSAEVLSAINSIPPFPSVALKAIQALRGPDAGAGDVVDIIQYDPGITANILRTVNSAYYGVPQKIASVKQAVSFLGSEKIINLLMLSGALSYLRGKSAQYPLENEDLLTHSVTTALLAETLGRQIGVKDPALIYTAGLLHDIGKIVLSTYVRDRYHEIDTLITQKGHSFLQAEQAVLGITHAEVGEALARHWQFPETITQPIGLHHSVPQKKSKAQTHIASAIVYLANRGSLFLRGRKSSDHWSFSDFEIARQRVGISPEELDACLDKLRTQLPATLSTIQNPENS